MNEFDAPEEMDEGGSDYELPDVKQSSVKTLQSVLGLPPDKAEQLAEAICMLAKEEPDDGPPRKGLDLIIAMGGKKPRK